MKSTTIVRASLLCAALLFAACGNNNNGGTDGGTGGGAGGGTTGTGGGAGGGSGGGSGGGTGGGAGGGAGGGSGGGGGASFTPCDIASPSCATGTSCMYYELSSTNVDDVCVPGACDIVDQDCPDGGACIYAVQQSGGAPTRLCAPPGGAVEGGSCGNNPAGCQKGLICLNGLCARPCRTAANCTTTGTACSLQIAFQGNNERPIFCTPSCDPLDQNTCGTTNGCYLTNNGTTCAPPGPTAVGGVCSNVNDCARGSTCVGPLADGGFECKAFCRFPNGTPACTSGQCARLQTQSGPVLDGGYGACL